MFLSVVEYYKAIENVLLYLLIQVKISTFKYKKIQIQMSIYYISTM